MNDHSGLQYLFDKPNLNGRHARWLDMIHEFNIQIKYIKGKDNRVENSLSRQIQINHLPTMSSYVIKLQDNILQAVSRMSRIWRFCIGCSRAHVLAHVVLQVQVHVVVQGHVHVVVHVKVKVHVVV